MKILKYLFLLLFLLAIGLVVFVSTQNSQYAISVSKNIRTSHIKAYNYVNNFTNWQDFVAWNEKTSFSSSDKSINWQGENNGSASTTFTKINDSIAQSIILNDIESKVNWKFIATQTGVKVAVQATGEMDLMQKLNQFFRGQSDNSLKGTLEKTLNNLDKNLDYELNTSSLKNIHVTTINKTFFIGKTINCDFDKVQKNAAILIKEMNAFFDKNKIKSTGKPFVMENSRQENRINISVCIPIKDSVYISPNSDVFASKIDSTRVVRATLTGDYSHLQSSRIKLYDYILKNKLKESEIAKPFNVYIKTKNDTRKPSQWVTEMNIPIYTKPKPIVRKPKSIVQQTIPIENSTE